MSKKTDVKTEPADTEEVLSVAPAEETKQEEKNIVYLGPTIMGVVRHSDVFRNGILPDRVQECISDFPMMKGLFVSIDNMPEAVKELRKKQSALSAIYNQTNKKYQTRR